MMLVNTVHTVQQVCMMQNGNSNVSHLRRLAMCFWSAPLITRQGFVKTGADKTWLMKMNVSVKSLKPLFVNYLLYKTESTDYGNQVCDDRRKYVCLKGEWKHEWRTIYRYYLFGSDIKIHVYIALVQTINDIHVASENRHVKGKVIFEQMITK